MKTLQDQYKLINEGKGNKVFFLSQARRLFPELISQYTSYDDTVKILKGKRVLTEVKKEVKKEENWKKQFSQFLTEAKGDKKSSLMPNSYDFEDDKKFNNLNGNSLLTGFIAEMHDKKNREKTADQLMDIVVKNLRKDPLFYVKSGQFATKGVGYIQYPEKEKEIKGKYKSSGMEVVKMDKSRISLLSEALGIFEEKRNTKKEGRFTTFKADYIHGRNYWKGKGVLKENLQSLKNLFEEKRLGPKWKDTKWYINTDNEEDKKDIEQIKKLYKAAEKHPENYRFVKTLLKKLDSIPRDEYVPDDVWDFIFPEQLPESKDKDYKDYDATEEFGSNSLYGEYPYNLEYFLDKFKTKMKGSTLSTTKGWVNGIKELNKEEKQELLQTIKEKGWIKYKLKESDDPIIWNPEKGDEVHVSVNKKFNGEVIEYSLFNLTKNASIKPEFDNKEDLLKFIEKKGLVLTNPEKLKLDEKKSLKELLGFEENNLSNEEKEEAIQNTIESTDVDGLVVLASIILGEDISIYDVEDEGLELAERLTKILPELSSKELNKIYEMLQEEGLVAESKSCHCGCGGSCGLNEEETPVGIQDQADEINILAKLAKNKDIEGAAEFFYHGKYQQSLAKVLKKYKIFDEVSEYILNNFENDIDPAGGYGLESHI